MTEHDDDDDDLAALREQVEELEAERDMLQDLLGDAESYLQHKPTCARLLTKRECDCGLVELMTRVHEETENGDEDDDDDDEDEADATDPRLSTAHQGDAD